MVHEYTNHKSNSHTNNINLVVLTHLPQSIPHRLFCFIPAPQNPTSSTRMEGCKDALPRRHKKILSDHLITATSQTRMPTCTNPTSHFSHSQTQRWDIWLSDNGVMYAGVTMLFYVDIHLFFSFNLCLSLATGENSGEIRSGQRIGMWGGRIHFRCSPMNTSSIDLFLSSITSEESKKQKQKLIWRAKNGTGENPETQPRVLSSQPEIKRCTNSVIWWSGNLIRSSSPLSSHLLLGFCLQRKDREELRHACSAHFFSGSYLIVFLLDEWIDIHLG